MRAPHRSYEQSQRDVNPSREADQERARAIAVARLRDRDIVLTGAETSAQLVRLLSAVEEFERTVGRCGGDSMVNTIRSSEPESEAFVIPLRRDDESAGAYAARVRLATERLAERCRERGIPEDPQPIVELEE